MTTIYKPKGRALEYSPDALALNIYTGCTHGCTYCYAAMMAKRWGKPFSENVQARPGIVEAVKLELERKKIAGKLIHLCFSCDPYPVGVDTTATRECIEAIKAAGNHVQILTKGGRRAERDLDLLDREDWFGVTLTGACENEPKAEHEAHRVQTLLLAHDAGIKTWVSYEPVLDAERVKNYIAMLPVDNSKIGKLNYAPSDIDWGDFGRECVQLCEGHGRAYYIKDDLRKEMEHDDSH